MHATSPACPPARISSLAPAQLLEQWGFSPHDAAVRQHAIKFAPSTAPQCRNLSAQQCPQPSTCDCSAAAPFYRELPSSEVAPLIRNLSTIRVFYIEGHTGPFNDMASFLHEELGIPSQNFDGVVFLQALNLMQQLDKKFIVAQSQMLGGNYSRQIAQFLTESRTGRSFGMLNCEKRGCRRAVYDDELRREFAARFGSLFEEKVDVVMCNFPTWQVDPLRMKHLHARRMGSPITLALKCSIFMYINVAVIMRYTHRYDHHLQGVPLAKGLQSNHSLSYSITGKQPESIAEEAAFVLRKMAIRPNVLLAVSNAYDWLYMRWGPGLDPLPWTGLAVQLSSISYTGSRPEALFCCGSSPYNEAIRLAAQVIINASAEEQERNISAPPLTFKWLGDLYPKGWRCVKTTTTADSFPISRKQNDKKGGTSSSSLVKGQLKPHSLKGRKLRLHNIDSRSSVQQFRLLAKKGTSNESKGKKHRLLKPSKRNSQRMNTVSRVQCGYRYSDVAAHPFAVLLPYSVHSYGFVQAYSLGLPILAPSLELLSVLHQHSGFMGHKGPGNVPWRSTKDHPQRTFFTWNTSMWYSPEQPAHGTPCCLQEPNDGCSVNAIARWLQFSDFYQCVPQRVKQFPSFLQPRTRMLYRPGLLYYDTPSGLLALGHALASNASWRHEISNLQKDFFRRERRRVAHLVRNGLGRVLSAVQNERDRKWKIEEERRQR